MKLEEWGLDHEERFQPLNNYPCPNCRGAGKVDGVPCHTLGCKGGMVRRWTFEPIYHQEMLGYREALKTYRREYAMFCNIMRKLTGAEKILLGLSRRQATGGRDHEDE